MEKKCFEVRMEWVNWTSYVFHNDVFRKDRSKFKSYTRKVGNIMQFHLPANIFTIRPALWLRSVD